MSEHEGDTTLADELVALRKEMEDLRAKNEELEAKTLALERNNHQCKKGKKVSYDISKSTVLSTGEILDISAASTRELSYSRRDGDEDILHANADVYSFLYCAPFGTMPMVLGFMVVVLQFSLFLLFLADLLDTQSLPPDVGILVRITQFICIVVCFLAQTDIRNSLRALMYREATEVLQMRFIGFSLAKFLIANLIMLTQGMLSIMVVIALIVYSDNVFDLLLNFTAVIFVSELDELTFQLALLGYAGRRTEKLAKRIQRTEYQEWNAKGCQKYLHVYIFIGLLLAAYGFLFSVIGRQSSNELLPTYLKVEFGDNLDPTLGLYSGCYHIVSKTSFNARVSYVQAEPHRGQGRFRYCNKEDTRSWIFDPFDSDDACDEPYLQSSEARPTSFDLLDANGDQWLLGDETPISKFQLVEVPPERFESECGDIQSLTEDLCPSLTMGAFLDGFFDGHGWSRTFELLTEKDEIITYYQHPVFIGTFSESEGYEIMFFTGRRWVLTSTQRFLGDKALPLSELISRFRSNEFWLLPQIAIQRQNSTKPIVFVSEAVAQATDQGTPLGLRWYTAQYVDGKEFAIADISRPSDALLRCGTCNAETNVCRYEGTCKADGTCECNHGTNGTLCDIKPLGNGVCNPYFNKDVEGYDGGDCCAATCRGRACDLVRDTEFAFGAPLAEVGTSFPNCKDPKLNPLKIELNATTDKDLSNGFTVGYTLKVECQDGKELPLNIILDPRTKLLGGPAHNISVSDTKIPCALSFSNIQLWTLLKISFQVLDDFYENEKVVVKREEGVTSDGIYEFPIIYNKCLKSALQGSIDPTRLYTGDYRDKAVLWLHDELSGTTNCATEMSADRIVERYALVAMSYAEEAPLEWKSPRDHCFWSSRVTCKGDKITSLAYDGNNNGGLGGNLAEEFTLLKSIENIDFFGNSELRGTLPTSIGDLTALTSLVIAENAISGTIPTEIGRMTDLVLIGLWRNSLEGTIPSELGALTKMVDLFLYRNKFTGTVPQELESMTKLELFNVFDNMLTGTIPDIFSRYSSLVEFDWRSNLFTGTIPASLGLHSQMTDLRLYENDLTGSIPVEFSGLQELVYLRLENNRMSGEIAPVLFGNWSSLEDLRLSNQFFSGSLPSEIANMVSIEDLRLDNNAFEGPIPKELTGFQNLTKLYLDSNSFTGTINAELMNLPLQVLRMQNNTFSGPIPSEISNLGGLSYLNLADNELTGQLPSTIGLLTDLQFLILSNNRLSGSLPSEILKLTNLRKLDLSGNLFAEEAVNEVMSALGLIFSCDETSVEIVLTTDDWPTDTTWEITSLDGNHASGGGYTLDRYTHEEKVCVPLDACKFTILDEFEDGGPIVNITRLGKSYHIDGAFEGMVELDICE